MLLYILDSANRLKSYSESLDAKTALCDKAWVVFNADGKKQVWKFRHDGTMSIAINGEFEIKKWMYDSSDNSINIMTSETTGICIKPNLYNGYLLGVHQDGTNQKMAMIDENYIGELLSDASYEVLTQKIEELKLVAYYQTEKGIAEKRKIEEEERPLREEQERLKKEQDRLENERLEKLFDKVNKKFIESLTKKELRRNKFISFFLIHNVAIYVISLITLLMAFFCRLIFGDFIGSILTCILLGVGGILYLISRISDPIGSISISFTSKFDDFLESQSLSEDDKRILSTRFSHKYVDGSI